jgi:hypothetical protein
MEMKKKNQMNLTSEDKDQLEEAKQEGETGE